MGILSDSISMSIYDTLTPYELRSAERTHGPEYIQKMMHKVPEAESVKDREAFIVERCKGKRVLNLGCASGALHEKIKAVAAHLRGIDKSEPADEIVDLDTIEPGETGLGIYYVDIGEPMFDLIVAGEILEHLSNPGNFLRSLKTFNCPVILSVPNAFCHPGKRWIDVGYEHVNPDHVAWYSWHTLKVLVERCGFTVREFYWYRGKPLTAEGLIFVVN